MIEFEVDTKKTQAYFNALSRLTSRALPKFVKGQAFSMLSYVRRSIRTMQKSRHSRQKIDDIAQALKSGEMEGIIVHENAHKRALANAPKNGQFGFYRVKKNREIKQEKYARSDTEKLNIQQLAVRYELGLRKSGIGSVQAPFAEAQKALNPYRNADSLATFSKKLYNPRAQNTWITNISAGKFSFSGVFSNDGLGQPFMQIAVQLGINRFSANMARHYYKKTGELLDLKDDNN